MPGPAAHTDTAAPPVHVIGGGPGGLATAAALHARGIRAVVLEKADAVGASWRGHYDRLHLHTTRRLSGLPGLAIPRAYGRWVGRDDVVRYLEQYVEHHGIEVVTGVDVRRVEPSPAPSAAPSEAPPSGVPAAPAGWTLTAAGGRAFASPSVVVATGFNHTPHLPDWPGRDTYTGELLHAGRYRHAGPYAGKDVLVVGTGNTGAEIAVDLAAGGAARVRLAVRTVPHLVRRSTAGWPAQATGILVRRLPPRVVDRAARTMCRLSIPDLSPYGLPYPETGLYTRVLEGAIPVQDVGLIDAVRAGRVLPVAAVESFDAATVHLSDGSAIEPDAVVAATGYRRGLEDLVGHLGVLDARGRPRAHGPRTLPEAPGLRFTGYTNPISGMLRELAHDARKIARAVARESRPAPSRTAR